MFKEWLKGPYSEKEPPYLKIILYIFMGIVLWLIFSSGDLWSAIPRLPGSDQTDKLEAAGTLLRIVDSFLFTWGARVFAGICVLTAGWSLKEQNFGVAAICIIAAIVIGTAPIWVKNIFEMGGGSLFSGIWLMGGCNFYV